MPRPAPPKGKPRMLAVEYRCRSFFGDVLDAYYYVRDVLEKRFDDDGSKKSMDRLLLYLLGGHQSQRLLHH